MISNNYKNLLKIDEECNENIIYAAVLLFLNTRLNQIECDNHKLIILEKINEFLGIDLENIDNVDNNKLIESFNKYPFLIWNSVQSLSDFMLTTEDILKKENLLILSDLILKIGIK